MEQPKSPRGTAGPRTFGGRRNRRILILCLATGLVLLAGIQGVQKIIALTTPHPAKPAQQLSLKDPLALPAQAAISSAGTGVRRKYSDFERMSIRHATIRVPD